MYNDTSRHLLGKAAGAPSQLSTRGHASLTLMGSAGCAGRQREGKKCRDGLKKTRTKNQVQVQLLPARRRSSLPPLLRSRPPRAAAPATVLVLCNEQSTHKLESTACTRSLGFRTGGSFIFPFLCFHRQLCSIRCGF